MTPQPPTPAATPVDNTRPRRLPAVPARVRDVMTAQPVTVGPASTVKDIAQILLARDIGSVPVIDVGGLLVGMVSEADLISREGYPTLRSHYLAGLIDAAVVEHRHHWAARAEGVTAGEIMTADVVTCEPAEPLAVVVRRMLSHDVRAVPVVDDGRLVGVVSRRDCLALFDRPDLDVAAAVTELLGNPLWTPEGHSVHATVTDGVVILTGEVRYHDDVGVVCDVAREVPGVVDVVDRVTWQERDPKPAPARDVDWR